MGAAISSLADALACALGSTLLPVLEVLADLASWLFSGVRACAAGTAECLSAVLCCRYFARKDTLHTTGAVYM